LIGNIPIAAAGVLFSQSLLDAVTLPEIWGDTSSAINYIGACLFMTDPTMDTTATPTGIRPLNLDTINKNMDAFVASASKAYTDGYKPAGSRSPLGNFSTISVPAVGQQHRLALVTSRTLWVITMVLTFITVVFIPVIVLRLEGRVPMSLNSVLEVTQSIDTLVLPVNLPVNSWSPASDGELFPIRGRPSTKPDYGTDISLLDFSPRGPIEPFTQHEDHSPDSPFTQSSRLGRLALFMAGELSYIIFAATCLFKRGLLLPKPMFVHQIEAKGGFTVLFIVWQTLSVFPAADIFKQTFSNEWSYQLERSRQLIPGTTENVSTLTASKMDRIRHCWTHSASSPFRIALLGSFIITALSSIAPSAIHVVPKSIAVPTQLQVGNLTITSMDDGSDGSVMADFAIQRAWLISRLEQIEESKFGYTQATNSMAAWPPLALANSSSIYQYSSDVVRYDYMCHWKAFSINKSTVSAAGMEWVVWSDFWYLGSPLNGHPNAGKFLCSCRLYPN
jgi:hypothetical protein